MAVTFMQVKKSIYWCKSPRASSPERTLSGLFTHELNGPFNLCISVSVEGGLLQHWTNINPEKEYLTINNNHVVNTWELFEFIEVQGEPEIVVRILYIPRSYIKFGRNGIWNLKNEYTFSVPEPIKSVLTHGRTGVFISNEFKAGF